MSAFVLSGGSHPDLARALARALGLSLVEAIVERFPDTESHVQVPSVAQGGTAIIVQSLGPPVNDHLIELLLLADACRRAGASSLVAVLPYLGYARQDRRDPGGAVGVRVAANLIALTAADRVLVVDPHIPSLEAVFSCPVDVVSAVPALLNDFRTDADEGAPLVVVAPDLGAMKLAERYASVLDCPTAVVRKHRVSGTEVTATEVLGTVRDRVPVIVDDILSTGGTVCAAAALLVQHGCIPRIQVVATHGLFAGAAVDRLAAHPIARITVTDTLPLPRSAARLPIETVGITSELARAIRASVPGSVLNDAANGAQRGPDTAPRSAL